MIFVGMDWAEQHHDIHVMEEPGTTVERFRIPDSLEGARQLQQRLADHAQEPHDVVIGVETDRGLVVHALIVAGYQVYAINPLSVSRYRERHGVSRAKSDAADAKVLADLVRTDRQNHRPIARDSEQSEALKVLTRSHQQLIWARQRQVNRLRHELRDYYPGALQAFADLTSTDAIAVLSIAPTPALGRALSLAEVQQALRAGGRQRYLPTTAKAIVTALAAPRLELPDVIVDAHRHSVVAALTVIAEYGRGIDAMERALTACFEQHPDAEILGSLPGLGPVLGARVQAELGDDPARYPDSKARKNYAGCAPVTRASGQWKVVHARFPRNNHLTDALYWWAFCALTRSAGARRYYRAYRARHGHTHPQALRALANRLVGILDGCLRHRQLYAETTAWPVPQDAT
ncbi:MAG: IS110 family transposase [Acetobacteraceae bacterium]|nr:IS110 family transposase [Acetobacteraceae bacterium]